MTRETKIGLLVGLAFIIVIGVLLSDHLTTRGELPQAQLAQVGDAVRHGAAVPTPSTPPIRPVTVPTDVTPVNRVLTQEELNYRPATTIVQIGPSPAGSQPTTDVSAMPVTAGAQEPAVLSAPIGQSLIAVAGTTGNPADDMKPVAPHQPLQVAANPSLKAIKAEKGDTVSHLASKYLGANTNANRQAIVDANPALKANPAMVIIGQTYMIPAKAAVAAAIPETVPATTLVEMNATRVEELMSRPQTKPVAAKPAGTSSYTVKDKDTLWKIASTQLGDPGMVKEIEQLNRDVIKKGVLQPGMVLKLPAKTAVASR